MLNPKEVPKELLRNCLQSALDKLYEKDLYLIYHEPKEGEPDCETYRHVSERGIVFRFGIYLEEQLRKHKEFDGYNLDSEYNRNGYAQKIVLDSGGEHPKFPDIIVHHRGDNACNLFIIEFKTWWNYRNGIDEDIHKLKLFINEFNDYKYEYALSITLRENRTDIRELQESKLF